MIQIDFKSVFAMNSRLSKISKCESGFSLLEALISVLVLSIGALGVAGLQTVSLKNSKASDQRGKAAVLAQMMVDTAALNYTDTRATSPNVVGTLANVPCSGTATTPLTIWQQRIDCAVPGGKGGVEYDRVKNRLVVTVEWNDSLNAVDGLANQKFLLDTRL
jgi:type IV pilus assembly protein PilV